MTFRDDRDALRAQINTLQRALDEAKAHAEELEDDAEERDELLKRVASLEAQLGIASEKKEPKTQAQNKDAKSHAQMTKRAWSKPLSLGLSVLGSLSVLGIAFLLFIAESEESAFNFHGFETDGPPSVGLIDLNTTPSPAPIPLQVEGSLAADTLSPDCRGSLPAEPQLVLRTQGMSAIQVSTSESDGDTVMALHTASGQWLCDDDSGEGVNARIQHFVGQGDHRIFVGTYSSGEIVNTQLNIHAEASSALPDESGLATTASATLGSLDVEAGVIRSSDIVDIRGSVEAAQVQSGCRGYLPLAPTAALHIENNAIYSLTTTDASADLVMMTRDARNTWQCDDDSGSGTAPAITGSFAPGQLLIWLGTYGADVDASARLSYERLMSEGVLDAYGLATEAPPTGGEVHLQSPQQWTQHHVVTGRLSTAQITTQCRGYVESSPTFAFTMASAGDVTFEFENAQPQYGLIIRHPDGHMSCGLERVQRMSWLPGVYRVWVSVPTNGRTAGFTLSTRTSPPSLQPWSRPTR